MPSDKELLKLEAKIALSDLYYFGFASTILEDEPVIIRPREEIEPVTKWVSQPRPLQLTHLEKWWRFFSISRGTWKTTIAAKWLTQEIIRDPNVTIMYHCEEKRQAVETVKMVRSWLERPKIIELYGIFKNERDWGGDQFTVIQRTRVQKDPTIQACGMDVAFTGWHPKLMVFDDLIGDTNYNAEGIRKVKHRLAAAEPVLAKGGTALWICTRWDWDDPSRGILEKWKLGMWDAPEPRGFFGAYAVPGDEKFFPHARPGEPLFESVLPEKELARIRSTIPNAMYYSQYLNDPLPAESMEFEPESLQYFDLQQTHD